MTIFAINDRVKVVGGHYFRKRGDPIFASVTKIISPKRIWVRFDTPQKSTRAVVVKAETYLSPNSLILVKRPVPGPIGSIMTMDTSSSLDDWSELDENVKVKIRDLCTDFADLGLNFSSSLAMLAYMQVGMRELE